MKISPSILNSNFLELKKEINKIKTADYIHLDIMDGNFVPNISFGPSICKQISFETKLLFDIHLMVVNPLLWIDKFSFSNTFFITVHYESNNYIEAINLIKKKGFKAGISIKPNTSITSIAHLLKDVDLVLIMSVEPGFGGQEYIKDSSGKINYLKQLREINGYNYVIEVDGGINETTIKEVKNADIVVVGSYLFKQSDIPKCIYDLKNTN